MTGEPFAPGGNGEFWRATNPFGKIYQEQIVRWGLSAIMQHPKCALGVWQTDPSGAIQI